VDEIMTTALYTSVLAFMFLVLSYNVILLRYRYNIPVGDGGNEQMQKLIQARANFVDYVPLGLIMLLILEKEAVPELMLHAMGGTIVFSRLLQGWGLSMSAGGSFGRVAGALLMHAVLIVGALACLGFFILRSGVLYSL
jgi:hypothetical protein